MKRKMFVPLLTMIILLSLVIAGCSPSTQPEAEPEVVVSQPEVPEEAKTIRKVVYFIGFGTGTAPDQIQPQQALIDKFNATHDDIEVELMIVPHEEAHERITSMIAGGNAPEIIGAVGFATIGILSDSGAIEDLTPYISDLDFDPGIFYPDVQRLMGDFFAEGLPAMPFGIYPSMVFYNIDAFDAAGLDYPPHSYDDQTLTFEKVREYGRLLTLDNNGNNATMDDFNPNNITQYGFDDSWTSGRNYMSLWGSEDVGMVTDADMKTAVANKPEWIGGLQWLLDGIWKDYFIADSAGQAVYSAMGSGDPFSTEMSAMFLTHTWYMPEGLTGITFPYDIAPVPVAPSGKRIVRSDIDAFAIIKQAKEKEAAFEFISWLVQEEQIVDVCLIYGCLPANEAAEDDFRVIMESKWPGLDYDVIYNGFDFLDNPHSDAYVVEQMKIEAVLNNMMSIVYTNPNANAAELLNEANQEIQDILDAYWSQ
jgi:multiple sugar transport system substrate-binding protein